MIKIKLVYKVNLKSVLIFKNKPKNKCFFKFFKKKLKVIRPPGGKIKKNAVFDALKKSTFLKKQNNILPYLLQHEQSNVFMYKCKYIKNAKTLLGDSGFAHNTYLN